MEITRDYGNGFVSVDTSLAGRDPEMSAQIILGALTVGYRGIQFASGEIFFFREIDMIPVEVCLSRNETAAGYQVIRCTRKSGLPLEVTMNPQSDQGARERTMAFIVGKIMEFKASKAIF
ncbi:hypothetical protein H7X65_03770 [Candidatus Parcubacteria bacterium]|nr:hypothetical protein [Candidatus Parcubacteria bacterium]